MESLDQFQCFEVREKLTNVFVMSPRLSDHNVLHHITSFSSHQFFSIFFNFAQICSLFFAHISYFPNFWSLIKEFYKTIIIPCALVGYETGYSQLSAMHLVGYPMHTHGIIVTCNQFRLSEFSFNPSYNYNNFYKLG